LAPGTDPNIAIALSVLGPYPDAIASLQSLRNRAFDDPAAAQPTSYGDEGYAGFYIGGNDYAVFVRRGAYIVNAYGDTPDAATMHALAAQIDQNLVLAGASLGPTAPPALFGVGLACGVREDPGLRLLACTASPFGQAADAALTYAWRLDGATRPDTGSTMQVDIVRENLPARSHVIGVTVTDTTNNVQATNSASIDTTTAAFAVSVTCTYAESQGTYELECSAAAANPPPNADISYAWTVNGASVGTTGETLSRSVGQGPVQVTVFARDSVSGQQTNVASYFVTINPVGTLTNLLTLGQTSDPQNVIDAVAGSAAVTLVVGAGAAIGAALAGAGAAAGSAGPAGAGSAAPGGATQNTPLNAQPMGGQTPIASGVAGAGAPGGPTPEVLEAQQLVQELLSTTEGTTPTTDVTPSAGASPKTTGSEPSTPSSTGAASTGPTSEQIGEGVGDLLAAEAGKLPSPSLDNLEKWRAISGFPNTPEGTSRLTTLLTQLTNLQADGMTPDADSILKVLRERAAELRSQATPPPEKPYTPDPDKPYKDAADLIDHMPTVEQLNENPPAKE
jgi:hypothetical protein